MPEYLAPGVYVEEVDTGSKPIEGVSTSTAGMVGVTRRGPCDGIPRLVTSFADYKRQFGGYFNFGSAFSGHQYLPYAVEGFFQNGGRRVYIKRVKGTSAAKSTETAQGGLVTRLKSDMSSTSRDTARLLTLRGIANGSVLTFTQVKDGVTTGPETGTVLSYDGTRNKVTFTAALGNAYESKYTTVETTHPRTNTFIVDAKDDGSWGDEVNIRVYHESSAKSEVDSLVTDPGNDIQLKTTAGFYVDAWIEIDRGESKFFRKITGINGVVITVDGAPMTPAADMDPQGSATATWVKTCEFRVSVDYEGISEEFKGLTLENVTGRYYKDVINKDSELIQVDDVLSTTDPLLYPSGDDGLHVLLAGGSDGTVPAFDDYKGVDNGPGDRTGIQALVDIDQVSIIAVPGISDELVQNAMINHCELLKDRFAVLDPPEDAELNEIQDHRSNYDTRYAAIYYPFITVRDPLTKSDINIPPSGHMVGIYARSDNERGVHKAPANEVIRGITGLEQIINKAEQDILNPRPYNINVLRDFRSRGRGYRVWGARCITSDTDWKYINVRRLFIFIEESIEEGTQWVVFEPNDEPTWARVRRSVTNFLSNVWRDGALQGATPQEAFFVKCDRTTMTQTDIDNGKLIMEIGIAPVKPAEYVIFRIGQWSGGTEVEEV